jgi:hypothetical protein
LSDGRGGRLTELAQTGSEFEALAVLNTEASPPGVTAGAQADAESPTGALTDAIELPLPYSLISPS